MSAFRVQAVAAHRIDEIYRHTADTWGEVQAERYIRGLFARFDAIAARRFPWRPIPAEFGVSGYVCRYESHVIYWKVLANGNVGIVTSFTNACTRSTASATTSEARGGQRTGAFQPQSLSVWRMPEGSPSIATAE